MKYTGAIENKKMAATTSDAAFRFGTPKLSGAGVLTYIKRRSEHTGFSAISIFHGIINRNIVSQVKSESTIEALDRLYMRGTRFNNVHWVLTDSEVGLKKLLSLQYTKCKIVIDHRGMYSAIHLVDKGLCYGYSDITDRKTGNKVRIYTLPACSIVYSVYQKVSVETGQYSFEIHERRIDRAKLVAWSREGSIYSETFQSDADALDDKVSELCFMEGLEALD